MKKLAKIIIICILIIGIIVAIIILHNNKKDNDTNNYVKDNTLEDYEDAGDSDLEDSLDKVTYNELIKIAKETEPSGTKFYSKFVEIGREKRDNEIDRYVWAQYGRSDENEQEISANSLPVKITIFLTDYSVVSSDVPPDGTDYRKYFPKVAEELEAMDAVDKEGMYENVFYGI